MFVLEETYPYRRKIRKSTDGVLEHLINLIISYIVQLKISEILKGTGQQTKTNKSGLPYGCLPPTTTSDMHLANDTQFLLILFVFVLQINQLPAEVRNTSWEVQSQIGKSLNPIKEPRNNDYRLVASRLGFNVSEIESFSQSQNPTMEMFKHCINTSVEELFQHIIDIGRKDVLDDLLKYLNQVFSKPAGHLPTQESLDDDEKSTLSQPLEESCTARYIYAI